MQVDLFTIPRPNKFSCNKLLLQIYHLLRGRYLEERAAVKKTAEKAFKKIVLKLLGVKPKKVFPIYTYPDEETHETKIVFYVELRKSKKFPDNQISSFSWFTLKQISRLKLATQTKQDITVGQRVIDSAIRKSLGQQTLE